METFLPGHSPLDDPLYAEQAWARYWRLMRGMALGSAVCVIIALSVLFYLHGFASIHLYIATTIAVFFSMMLMAALMGLVFMSSSTGHDESIDDPVSESISPDE